GAAAARGLLPADGRARDLDAVGRVAAERRGAADEDVVVRVERALDRVARDELDLRAGRRAGRAVLVAAVGLGGRALARGRVGLRGQVLEVGEVDEVQEAVTAERGDDAATQLAGRARAAGEAQLERARREVDEAL